jgi:hypothetical protein
MSVVIRPGESHRVPPGSASDDELVTYAPRWIRNGMPRPRKVVPIRIPDPTFPSSAAVARPRPLMSFEGEPGRPMQRQLLDPQADVAAPSEDRLGLALGMIARLIVAGCAAAAVALMLIGAIPMPFKAAAPTFGRPAAAQKSLSSAEMAAPERAQKSTARLPTGADPVASTAAKGASQSTRAAEAPQPPAEQPPAIDPGEVDRLVQRGREYLDQGDIAAARLILTRAAEARDGRAALALGETYDPLVLRQLRVVGFKPDVAHARAWYERAAEYGAVEASRWLATLPQLDQ